MKKLIELATLFLIGGAIYYGAEMLLLISGNRIVNVRISNRRARHVKRGQAHDLDESIKKCVQDTNFSPIEYAQSWEDAQRRKYGD